VTTRQIVEMIAQEIGQPVRTRTAGRFLIALLGLFNPIIREFKEMAYEFEEPYLVDHCQFAQAFGDISTPLPESLRATITWYRQRRQAGLKLQAAPA